MRKLDSEQTLHIRGHDNHSSTHSFWATTAALVCALSVATNTAAGERDSVDGFTAPYQIITIGAPESGVVETITVKEGDRVKKGDLLATLDRHVHLALLAIAKQSMQAEGQLQAARAELTLHERRLEALIKLREQGHARRDEVERTTADRDVAAGNVRAAEEQHLLRELEYDKIKAQLERRSVRAPLDGVVTTLLKHEGELAAPNNPDLLVLVRLDPLTAEFAVPRQLATQIHEGQTVSVTLVDSVPPASATVEYVAPVTDAESGTVKIKVRIENPNGDYRSGEPCRLKLDT